MFNSLNINVMETMITRNDISYAFRPVFLLFFMLISLSFLHAAPRIASVNGDWNNITTWGGSSIPTATDDVTINSGITVNINVSNAVCASLQINNNVDGTATVVFTESSSKLVVSGPVVLSGNSLNRNGTLSMSFGGVLECNSINLGSGNVIFSPGSGTLQLNAANTFPLSYVNNLIVRNGITTLGTNLTIQGDLTIDLGTGYAGQIDVSTNNYSVTCAGNWYHKNPSDGFIERSGTVTFNGAGDQIFTSYGLYNNIVVNKPSGSVLFQGWVAPATLNNILEIYGNLTITSGTLRIDNNAARLSIRGNLSITGILDVSKSDIINPGNRTAAGGSITMTGNGLLKIGGTNTFPTNYSNISLAASSTVEYCGTNQTVRGGITYGNIHITTVGTKSLAANTNVSGNIIVSAGTFNTGIRRITLNGNANQTIQGVQFYQLTLNNTSSYIAVTLLSETSISNNLTCTQGVVDATNFPLIILESATVNGATNQSHVVGVVKKVANALTVFTFPIGNGEFYRPISIHEPSNNTWNAQYFFEGYGSIFSVNSNDNPKIHHVSDIEYWDISPETSGGTARISLSWNGNSDVLYPQYLLIAHWNSSQNYWESVGGVTIDDVNMTITSNELVSNFSPFTLGSSNEENPLPIELASIDGYCDEKNTVHLLWATASETNNEFFTVYKSPNGQQWTELIKLDGAGTSNVFHSYKVTDMKVPYYSYYKIIQTDFDGKQQEFDIMSVFCKQASKEMSISPLQANDVLYFKFFNFSHLQQKLVISLINQQGKVISIHNITTTVNENVHAIPLSENMPEGMYFIDVKLENNSLYSATFIKKSSVYKRGAYIADIHKVGF